MCVVSERPDRRRIPPLKPSTKPKRNDMNEGIRLLLGKTLTSIKVNNDNDEIIFTANDGTEYKMWHRQDCCERVSIEDVNGDWDDLIGNPILVAEENSSTDPTPEQVAEKKSVK